MDDATNLTARWIFRPWSATLLRKTLAALPLQKRHELLQSHLCNRLTNSLRLGASSIDTKQPLNCLGIDSLKAAELQRGMESELGVTISLTSVMTAQSIGDLVSDLLRQMMVCQEEDH